MKSHQLKLVLLALLIIGTLAGVKIIGFATINLWMQGFMHYVQGLGWWGIFLFAIVYGIASLLAIPVAPLTIGAGIIFTFGGGLLATMLGAAIGGALGFLTSRYLAREAVAQRLAGNPKFNAIDTAIGNEGWKIIILLRMCPFPFGLSNYVYGMTSIKFWNYLWATLLGILPACCFFVYLGAAGKAGLNSASNKNPSMLLPLGLGLVAGVVCLVFVGNLARRAVAKAAKESPVPAPQLVEVGDEEVRPPPSMQT